MKTTFNLKGIKIILVFCFFLLTYHAFSQIELVKDINTFAGQGSNPSGFTEVADGLYFLANDGEHGQELWHSNGTTNGTQLVKDINPGTAHGVTLGARMVPFNNRLYFLADDGQNGKELWSSNLTSTAIVEDLRPGDNSNHIFFLTVVNNRLLFQASPVISDVEWWKVNNDNTVENVKDINPGSGGAQLGAPSVGLDLIFFEAHSGGPQGSKLWITDGTESGTKSIEDDMRIGSGKGVEYNGKVYLMADKPGNDGFELFKADQSGASIVRDINPEEFGSSQPKVVDFHGAVYKGHLYFNAFEPIHADALWKTDGTEAGTVLVKDIYPGSDTGKGAIGAMTVYNDYLYFAAQDSTPGLDLWRTDGTESGTIKIKDFGGGISGIFYALDDKLYFTANDGLHGTELWVSDGTEEGTKMVEDFNPGPSHGIGYMTVFKDKIFLGGFGPLGHELYTYTPIDCEAPMITSHPLGDTINEGESITLTVVATGDGLTYQWQKDNENISKAISASFTIDDATPDKGGEYTCRITNECTTVISNKASLIVEKGNILGAEISDNKNVLKIFPNPTNEWLNITMNIPKGSNEKVLIAIFNMQGFLVIEKAFDLDNDLLNVANLASGLYLIKILNARSVVTSSKFSIQH